MSLYAAFLPLFCRLQNCKRRKSWRERLGTRLVHTGHEQLSYKSLIAPFNKSTLSLPTLTCIHTEPQQPSHNISGADLASYQFPVDEEEEESLDAEGEPTRHEPSLNRQPSTSAMKKSPSDHSVSIDTDA